MNRLCCVPVVLALASASLGQTTFPGEFESPTSLLRPSFSYFGGVAGYTTAHSTTRVFSGNALQLNINFRPDAIFTIAGAGFVSDIMTSPALARPIGADTFSMTVSSPVSGKLQAFVRVREDDNADGIIALADDDQWESPAVTLNTGVNVINVPFSAFFDTNPDEGNDTQNFLTTPRLRYFVVIESRTTLPGGIQQTPVSVLVDHVGFFVGNQTPPSSCSADFDGDGALTPDDLSDYIACYFALPPCSRADINADGVVNPDDLSDLISAYFLGCS